MTWAHPKLQTLSIFLTLIDHLRRGVARQLCNCEKWQPLQITLWYVMHCIKGSACYSGGVSTVQRHPNLATFWRCLTLSPKFDVQSDSIMITMSKLKEKLDKSHGPSSADFKASHRDVYFVYLRILSVHLKRAGHCRIQRQGAQPEMHRLCQPFPPVMYCTGSKLNDASQSLSTPSISKLSTHRTWAKHLAFEEARLLLIGFRNMIQVWSRDSTWKITVKLKLWLWLYYNIHCAI